MLLSGCRVHVGRCEVDASLHRDWSEDRADRDRVCRSEGEARCSLLEDGGRHDQRVKQSGWAREQWR